MIQTRWKIWIWLWTWCRLCTTWWKSTVFLWGRTPHLFTSTLGFSRTLVSVRYKPLCLLQILISNTVSLAFYHILFWYASLFAVRSYFCILVWTVHLLFRHHIFVSFDIFCNVTFAVEKKKILHPMKMFKIIFNSFIRSVLSVIICHCHLPIVAQSEFIVHWECLHLIKH